MKKVETVCTGSVRSKSNRTTTIFRLAFIGFTPTEGRTGTDYAENHSEDAELR